MPVDGVAQIVQGLAEIADLSKAHGFEGYFLQSSFEFRQGIERDRAKFFPGFNPTLGRA